MFRLRQLHLLQQTSPGRWLGRLLLVLLAYFVSGRLGLAFPYIGPNVTLIWLPSGVAVAALLRWGSSMSLAIWLATLVLNWGSGLSVGAAACIALGNVAGPWLCCLILQRQQFSSGSTSVFRSSKDVRWFCFASAFGMLLPATSGCLVLWYQGFVASPGPVWLSWWAGDMVGVLLGAPLLLSWSLNKMITLKRRLQESLSFTLIFAVAHWLIFFSQHNQLHLAFIGLALVIWAALRFDIAFASVTVLVSSVIATWATYLGLGQFSSADSQSNLFILWVYIATLTVVSLLITALQAERLLAASELRETLDRVNKIASRLPGLIMQYRIRPDRSVCVPYASAAIFSVFEVTADQVRENAFAIFERIDPEDVAKWQSQLRQAASTASIWQSEFRFRRHDGAIRWLYIDALPEFETDGGMLWHCFITDITERKQAEQDLRIAAITFESQEGIFVTDGQWQLLRLNQAFTRITGYTTEELVGQTVLRLKTRQQDQAFFAQIDAALKVHRFWQGELWGQRKDGEIYPQMITLTAIADSQGEVSNYIGSFTDISLHKSYEEEIRYLAFYDALTQLPNRRLLIDRLQHLISVSERNHGHSAILFIDLDNFKTLNDTRGHDAGDLLLIESAARLKTCVRDGDTVARLGGDEFVVVLESLSSNGDEAYLEAAIIGEKIRLLLSQVYQLAEFEHHGSGSIGICLFQGGDTTVKDLFKRADTAMYEAKTSGRNAVRFFDPAMQAVLVVRMMLESNLRVALALEQFQLYYQIQMDADGRVIGAEALLRWMHPDRGFISPVDFIPLAEETGLIIPIGNWVLETACVQLKLWAMQANTAQLSLAVNVSAKQFQQADFVELVSSIVHKHQIDASRLKIELTESTILDNVQLTTEKMHQLKKLGIAFSMDDFGTGYSSLAYLQRLPLNQLKIDQSFVRDLNDDENDATIVRAIISLGINLGLHVIAEGVETLAQRGFLIQHHCLAFQGFLFSQPVPAEALPSLLAQLEAERQRNHQLDA
ncbi:hypothetical protein BH11PSE12_BH11PSE12_29270 [soil metagenome]